MIEHQRSNRKIVIIGIIAVMIMFGFCFAIVPLYSLICKQTGINTSAPNGGLLTPVSATVNQADVDKTRTITVQLITVNHNGLAWDFFPRTTTVHVHPGENNTVYFHAKNTTEKSMSVQAIPSMTPTDALSYFHKIQCFCFVQQTLRGGESKEMPMIFRVDKELPKNINTITLAYTLFDTTADQKG